MPTVKELKQRCKALGLRGYSKLLKNDLIRLLNSRSRSRTPRKRRSQKKKKKKINVKTLNRKLLEAIKTNNNKKVKKLLKAGANPNLQDENGYTPLMLASEWARTEIVKKLLEYGADPNAQTKIGYTTLMYASMWRGRTEIVKLLIEAGADPNAKDKFGDTLLLYVSRIGETEIVKLLLADPKTNINAKDEDGNTALMLASMRARARQLDLDRGIPPESSDGFYDHAENVQLLERAIAKQKIKQQIKRHIKRQRDKAQASKITHEKWGTAYPGVQRKIRSYLFNDKK